MATGAAVTVDIKSIEHSPDFNGLLHLALSRDEQLRVRSATHNRVGYRTGEKGRNRVRLYAHPAHPAHGTMMLEYRDNFGAKQRVSLHHSDFESGKAAAERHLEGRRRNTMPRRDS